MEYTQDGRSWRERVRLDAGGDHFHRRHNHTSRNSPFGHSNENEISPKSVLPSKIEQLSPAHEQNSTRSIKSPSCPTKHVAFDYLMLFKKADSSNKSIVEFMREFISLSADKFTFTFKKSYGKNEKKYYEACMMIVGMCNFVGKGPSKKESKNEALKLAYIRFGNFCKLFQQFSDLKSQGVDQHDLMLHLKVDYEDILVIKYNTKPNSKGSKNVYSATITLVNFASFQVFTDKEEAVQRLAFEKMYPYIETLSEKFGVHEVVQLPNNQV